MTRHSYQRGSNFLFENTKADFSTSVLIEGNCVVASTNAVTTRNNLKRRSSTVSKCSSRERLALLTAAQEPVHPDSYWEKKKYLHSGHYLFLSPPFLFFYLRHLIKTEYACKGSLFYLTTIVCYFPLLLRGPYWRPA
jgi:hypothetical protein